jgi:hypothetical protein
MSEAIFGLVGVIIGAFAAGLGDYLLETRRESRMIRRAARLLQLELEEARDFIRDSLDRTRWIAEPERVLSNEVWFQHRDAFASVEDAELWSAVSNGFIAIAGIRRMNRNAPPGTDLDPGGERAEDAEAGMGPIQLALEQLRSFLS